MAKPSTPSDWQFIVDEREEQIRNLNRSVATANLELTSSRKDVERLKTKCLELEDDVTTYKADSARWHTLYDEALNVKRTSDPPPPFSPGGSGNKQQIEELQRQLMAARKENQDLIGEMEHLRIQGAVEQPDNPILKTELQQGKIEINTLRYNLEQKNNEIKRLVKEQQDQVAVVNRLNLKLKSKTEEIDRLRNQLISSPLPLSPVTPPVSPQGSSGAEVMKLKTENKRLNDLITKLQQDIRIIEDRNIHLHQQNLLYEDDYRREKEEKELKERQLKTLNEEVRNLKAVIDVINPGGGRIGGLNVPNPNQQ